jgi:hypothetical protein
MEPVFEEIYYELYTRAYVNEPPDFFPITGYRSRSLFALSRQHLRVRRAIDSANSTSVRSGGPELRPDAKYILLVNMMEMVIRPLEALAEESPYLLSDDLETDVLTIVKIAAAQATRGTDAAIGSLSAHSLVDALATSWNELRLSKISLWGA